MSLLRTAAIASVLLVPAAAQAGSGQAVVPHWQSRSSDVGTKLHITNIGSVAATVTVTFYDKTNTPIGCTVTYDNFTSNNTVLGAGQTGVVQPLCGPVQWGYATISWSNGQNSASPSLVAYGYRFYTSGTTYSEAEITVNQGLPF
ncbi:MAG TPA: hypothetical protein VED40_18015 [Azospirillaceae bacterium]|nr:hypothetical protein [Azospirillaceae bacterium]